MTTIDVHHSVGSVTRAVMPLLWSRSNSALSLSRYANGTDRGVSTQNGLASLVRAMWNFSPSIVLMISSKTFLHNFLWCGYVPCAGIESMLALVGFG